MKNVLTYKNGSQDLLANVDDGSNTIYINGSLIPSTDWVGTGTYTTVVTGTTISIERISDLSGNIMLQKVSTNNYRLVKSSDSPTEGNYIAWSDNPDYLTWS